MLNSYFYAEIYFFVCVCVCVDVDMTKEMRLQSDFYVNGCQWIDFKVYSGGDRIIINL